MEVKSIKKNPLHNSGCAGGLGILAPPLYNYGSLPRSASTELTDGSCNCRFFTGEWSL